MSQTTRPSAALMTIGSSVPMKPAIGVGEVSAVAQISSDQLGLL